MDFKIQYGNIFLTGKGDRQEFTLTYHDLFIKCEHRFVNRFAFYELVEEELHYIDVYEDETSIKQFIKACKEQVLHGGEKL